MEQARNWLTDPARDDTDNAYRTSERSSVAGWAEFNAEGVPIGGYTRQGCHFSLQWRGRQAIASLTCNARPTFNREAAVAFYAWAFGPDGPYRAIFEGTEFDPEFAADYGFIFTDPSRFADNFFYNAVIASRFPTEHAAHCTLWHKRVTEHGIHPGLAWWSTYMTLYNNNSNHQAFDWARVSETYVLNLCNGVVANPGPRTPCNVVWGDAYTGGMSGNNVSSPTPLLDKWRKDYPDLTPRREADLIKILTKEQERLGLLKAVS